MFSKDVGCLHRQQPPTEANLTASHVPSPGEDTEIYLFRTGSKTVRCILIHHLLAISPGAPAKKGGRRGSYELGAPRRLGGCGSEGSLCNTLASLCSQSCGSKLGWETGEPGRTEGRRGPIGKGAQLGKGWTKHMNLIG